MKYKSILMMASLCALWAQAADYTVITADEAQALGGATGGDEIRRVDNGNGTADLIHIFKSGTQTLSLPDASAVMDDSLRALIVGGGGSGGGDCGGGGGAGGLVYLEGLALEVGDATVTVGAGGAAASKDGKGNSGENSLLTIAGTTYTALGGGGGAWWSGSAGKDGGSGGGAVNAGGNGASGASIQASTYGYGFGNAGSGSTVANAGGGGGGAGGAGTTDGVGGAGLEYDISGESQFYAAGGGGGLDGSRVSPGGSGIGGTGGVTSPSVTGGTAGAANTGSGGGGNAGSGSRGTPTGAGGSGVVILRYTLDLPVEIPTADGETIIVKNAETNWVDGELVLTFADVEYAGELTLPRAAQAWVLAVGGGGAGANPGSAMTVDGGAGGGGAGAFNEQSNLILPQGKLTIEVGAGGVNDGSATVRAVGANGAPSFIQKDGVDLLRAIGGGGGGICGAGSDGGSGGGGSQASGGAYVYGQGHAGGKGLHNEAGAGGGGAGGAGGDTTGVGQGGAGGAGLASFITGHETMYAAGGGGGTRANTKGVTSVGGQGGSGIGGTGAAGSTSGKTAATAGQDGTGSGGGGGCYNRAGGAGGSGVVIVRIKMMMPTKPAATATYSYGDIQTIYTNAWPTAVTVTDQNGTEIAAITSDLSVGTYTYTSTLAAGCTWADGTTGAVTTIVTITKPTLFVESLTLAGWQAGGAPSLPVLVVTNAQGTVVTLPVENVTYKTADWAAGITLTDWPTAAANLAAGTYTLTVAITGTANYEAPTEIPTVDFTIWASPVAPVVTGLGYTASLVLANPPASETTILVILSPEKVPGFTYDQVEDPAEIRFVANGQILASTVDVWDVTGESTFFVTVPAGAGEISINWGRTVDEAGEVIPLPDVPAGTIGFVEDFRRTTAETVLPTGWAEYQYNGSNTPRFELAANGAVVKQPWKKNALDAVLKQDLSVTNTFTITTYSTSADCNTIVYLSSPNYSVCVGNSYTSNKEISIGSIAGDASTQFVSFQNGAGTKPENITEVAAADVIAVGGPLTYTLNVFGTSLWGTVTDGTTTKEITFTLPEETVFERIGLMLDGAVGSVGVQEIRGTGAILLTGDMSYTCTHTTTIEGSRFKNRWLVEPSLDRTTWGAGTLAWTEVHKGLALYGAETTQVIFTRVDTGAQWTDEIPTDVGAYEVVFVVPAAADTLKAWTGLRTDAVEVTITDSKPTSDLSGGEGSPTRSGRVLLANNYTSAEERIVDQDYANTTPSGAYWEHSTEDVTSIFPYLKAGRTHRLASTNGVEELSGATNIWKLSGVYLGNTHDCAITPAENARPIYLPSGEANPTHLVLTGESGIKLESATYRDGIGTIYFDAVNGWQDPTGTNYAIRLEYLEGTFAEGDDLSTQPWQTATLHPLLWDSKVSRAGFQALASTTSLKLNVTNANDSASLYRVYAPINVRGPVRFRIVRETAPDVVPDRGGFILMDNVIVSYPASRAQLLTTGVYFNRTGKEVLGYEGAWSVPFPSATDETFARAKVKTEISPLSAELPKIVSARVHYRWRYLDQVIEDWRTATLDPTTLVSAAPLELPSRVGDVEFWHELIATAPFYQYYDYSGTGRGLSSSLYTEEISVMTNGFESVRYPSGGTNWFVRLREGASSIETIRAHVRRPSGEEMTEEDDVVFELTGNGVWRGFLKTLTAAEEGLRVQFETVTAGETAELSLTTNIWTLVHDATELPASVSVKKNATTNDWSTLVCDAATGGLLLQYDEATQGLTISHADYQDFNRWHDAHKEKFVGTSTENEKKSGVSAKMRDFESDFSTWEDTPSTYTVWQESFTDSAGSFARWEPNVSFSSHATPNGWVAGPGMFVNAQYNIDGASGALQLQGQGKGYLEYPGNMTHDPRGIESISFKARLAQSIAFDDICYMDADSKLTMTNYTFMTQFTLSDDAQGTDYDGYASASVIAAYRPKVGCYEFRVTREQSNRIGLYLYKWTYDAGTIKAHLLLSDGANGMVAELHRWKNASGKWEYPAMYISLQKQANGTVKVQAGLSKSHALPGGVPIEPSANLCVWDNDNPLTAGTYGIISANAPATFIEPRTYQAAVSWLGGTTQGSTARPSAKITYPTSASEEKTNLASGRWAIQAGRLVYDSNAGGNAIWGVKSDVIGQKIVLQIQEAGTGKWIPVATNEVSGFTLSAEQTITVRRVKDAIYRLAHGGTDEDARADIVVDDVTINQWRGTDFGNWDANYALGVDADYGYRTNFVFTSGWVTDHAVRLSAKRTKAGSPCSIRSPYMDGQKNADGTTRGLGLGMISFDYKNAQPNANLLIQVATNITSVVRTTAELEEGWTTITNVSFATKSAAELKSGKENVYLGLHGVKGLVRILMDPASVEGEIDITGVLCRDEPVLDLSSWWGWNVNTYNGFGTKPYLNDWSDGQRTYLYDVANGGENGFSLALNNSISKDIVTAEGDLYKQHMPFVQTPTFVSNIVGEVSFKARRYDTGDATQLAEIRLYGSHTGDTNVPDTDWQELAHFTVSNTYFETYHHRVAETYRAFRLAVTGVPGIDAGSRGPDPEEGQEPVRVMIDELLVSEAVFPKVGFRYVYPVRTGLDTHAASPAVLADGTPNPDEQPLAGESWTIQAEVEVKRLPEEVDPSKPMQVLFYWQRGHTNWAQDAWTKTVTPAELLPVEGETYVFRGSFDKTPGRAIVDESNDATALYKYTAAVVYTDKDNNVHTNFLELAEWQCPDWLKWPRWVKPTEQNVSQETFSPFTVLEPIAPNRVWFNEVNVFDGRQDGYYYSETNQYVELAVPMQQSIDGWRIDCLSKDLASTNLLCVFGTEAGQVKPNKLTSTTNDYSFIVVQSPKTAASTTWTNVTRPTGEKVVMDGTWDKEVNGTGELTQNEPILLRLIRPSGIVAQVVALEGTNRWNEARFPSRQLEAVIANYNATASGKAVSYAIGTEKENGPVIGLLGQSLNVTNGTGATTADWSSLLHQTPGWVNEGQVVPEDYVILPNGSMIVITARVEGMGMSQTFGESVETTEPVRVLTKKGGEGTNITYTVANWYEIASVATNGTAMAGLTGRQKTVNVILGAGCSNNLEVIATAQPWSKLRDYGLDANDRYTDAVMDWLTNGTTLRGPFANDGEINPGEYHNLSDAKIADLSLKDCYWLDIDPTTNTWWFKAGITSVGVTNRVPQQARQRTLAIEQPEDPPWTPGVTNNVNILVGVQMMITNTTTAVAYSPDVLRSVTPGLTSRDFDQMSEGAWNSATFKITADIQNGMPMRERWIPLRWFYFLPGSFDAEHKALVEVLDPFDENSSMTQGWAADKDSPVFYRWAIDDNNMPMTIEALKPQSTY